MSETTNPRFRKPIRVLNVIGNPQRVESAVNEYLKAGYFLNSELMLWISRESPDLFVQQVVLYEDEENESKVS